MKRLSKILLAASALLAITASEARAGCADFYEFAVGSYRVTNNVWSRNGQTASNCVSQPKATFYRCSWAGWTGESQVHSYCSAYIGWKPWNPGTTNKTFPKRINAITSATASYNLTESITGKYNTALEMWITSGTRPTPGTIKTEIMIWLNSGGGMQPAGSDQGNVLIGANTYNLWSGQVSTWKYIALKQTDAPLSGTVNLKAILDALVAAKLVSATDYLADVEFGNEVMNGAGTTTVKTFGVAIK